jgi:hypothetical protein
MSRGEEMTNERKSFFIMACVFFSVAICVLLVSRIVGAQEAPQLAERFDFIVRVTELLGALVLGGIGYLLKKTIDFVSSKSNSAWVRGVLGRVDGLAMRIVREIYQKEIEALKEAREDGKLTDEEKERFKTIAMDTLKEYVGPKGIKELTALLGASGKIDKFLSSTIEATIATEKTRPQAGNP